MNYFLGHRRLSIVDLSERALQPMVHQDTGAVLVFNGEIYNHRTLRERLEERGHVFVTDHSDSEVLLRAFVEWGDECVRELDGMFAFAVYEPRRHRVFLARDGAGQKPLYYRIDGSGLVFSSELTQVIDASPGIDVVACAQYLALAYVPAPRSIATGVAKLNPGHRLSFDLRTGEWSNRQYWDVASVERPSSKRPMTSEILAQSVQHRLAADVPVSIFLSGGIDSTCVAKFAGSRGPMKAFTAEFDDGRFHETDFADAAARRYGLPLDRVPIAGELVARRNEIIDAFDEPFGGLSAVTSFQLFERTRRDAKVVLTGDGGDELFYGYSRFFRHAERMCSDRKSGCAGVEDYMATNSDLDLVGLLAEPPPRSEVLRPARAIEPRPEWSPATAVAYFEFKTSLPGRMLMKLDRTSMAHSVEGRSPFVGHRLVEHAFSLPPARGEHHQKHELKAMLRPDLGAAFVDRPKLGFGHPLRGWFGGPHRGEVLEPLRTASHPVFDVLDYDAVHRMFPSINGCFHPPAVRKIWRLLVLARFVERTGLR